MSDLMQKVYFSVSLLSSNSELKNNMNDITLYYIDWLHINMEGIINWSISANWFFNQTLSIYVTTKMNHNQIWYNNKTVFQMISISPYFYYLQLYALF